MRIGTLCVLTLVITGCGDFPDVLDLGNARYSVTIETHVKCLTSSRPEAVEAANDYCSKSHQTAVIESFEDRSGDPGLVPACSTSVIFHCQSPH